MICKICCCSKYFRRCCCIAWSIPEPSGEVIFSGIDARLYFIAMECIHAFDIWTDIYLARNIYSINHYDKHDVYVADRDEMIPGNYNMAFMWIVMSITVPYIIQYSSMMNTFYLKDYFSQANWKNYSCLKKLFHFIIMSFLGLVVYLPMLEILIKVQALTLLLTCLCCFKCCSSKKSVDIWVFDSFEKLMETCFMMNTFEI